MNIDKILYIGTGCHIEPIIQFPYTKEFIFIDTLPRAEADEISFSKNLYKTYFIVEVINRFKDYGFTLMEKYSIDNNYHNNIFTLFQKLYYKIYKKPQYINPHVCIFFNMKTNQTVKYYISTNILYNMNTDLLFDIKNADALLISRYFPDIKLLDFFDKPKILLAYSNTYYKKINNIENSDIKNILYFLHNNNNNIISKYFSKFYYINYNTSKKTEYNCFNDMIIKK